MIFTKLFTRFFDSEKVGGLLLLFCTLVSLIIANSGWGERYVHFWHQPLDASVTGLRLNLTVEQWINDGLMTVFFLLVGLEIEREFYAGELSSWFNALLPVGAAVGGMVVPAAIHFAFNAGTPTQAGFGIPMATDIAFALGVLALAGSRVPYSVKIFLTALAIIDDLGATLVIAVFYGKGITWPYLAGSASILLLLWGFGKAKIYSLWLYLLPGMALWYCTLQSGIHPTIAGVLLAFVIPFSGNNENTPSYRLQAALHKPVAFLIVPLFALANTGIALTAGWPSQLFSSNGLGIVTGLVVGKPIGILLACWLLVKLTKAALPEGAGWPHLAGAAALGGIGFTMSIFISNLAFENPATVSGAKIAVLLASAVASFVGLTALFANKKEPEGSA